MGAWGYGIYDNDKALDALSIIESYVEEYKEDYVKALLKYKNEYCNDTSTNYYDNDSILLAADVEIEHTCNLDIFKELVVKSIKEELNKENLSKWSDFEERKKELLKFNNKINKYL